MKEEKLVWKESGFNYIEKQRNTDISSVLDIHIYTIPLGARVLCVYGGISEGVSTSSAAEHTQL